MKKLLLLSMALLLAIGGCGVNKDYVSELIAASEARTDAKVKAVEESNAAEIAKLRMLATELEKKTDMAINEAKGFEDYQIIWSGEINFDFDSYEIDDVAAQILTECGDKMTSYPASLLEVTGHTDATGSGKYNLLLGEKRANSAKRFLAERFGISLYRMFIISYGKTKPAAGPDEKNANLRNRRVTLTIWGRL